MNKDALLLELEAGREQLLAYVNNSIDAIIARIKSGESISGEDSLPAVTIYPLHISPGLFKGTKPVAVHFGAERVEVKTWRSAYTLILRRCADIPEKRGALMRLRGKVSGRNRCYLAGKPDGMNVPVKIADDLFAEGYLDTEWLVRVLTTEILDDVRYDYSGIAVSVTAGKRGRSASV